MATSNFLTQFTGGYSLSDLPSCFTLYITLGICVLFLVLIISCAVVDNKEESPLGNIKTEYPQIAPIELPQVQLQTNKENYQAIQENAVSGGSDNRSNEDIEDIIVTPPVAAAPLPQAQIEMQVRVAPLPQTEKGIIVKTESIKLKGAGAKFLVFHNYLNPFTKIPDSISRPKKCLLLFLRVITIYYLTGAFYSNALFTKYISMVTSLIKGTYIVYIVLGGIAVIAASIALYIINFFVVVPSRERIVILMQKRGTTMTEAIAVASSKISCARCCNIFGVIMIVLMLLAVAAISFIMPSNFVATTRLSWMITFAFAVAEDLAFFQMVKIFFLLCFIGCCGGNKERLANGCGLCCNSFVAGKIVYI